MNAPNRTPLINSNGLEPVDLLTRGEYGLIERHAMEIKDAVSPEQFERALKGWAVEERAEVARLYQYLRSKGWYNTGWTTGGRIQWRQLAKSGIQKNIDSLAERESEKVPF